jgi:hypothetical protein
MASGGDTSWKAPPGFLSQEQQNLGMELRGQKVHDLNTARAQFCKLKMQELLQLH